jgi:colicin import membrane protein
MENDQSKKLKRFVKISLGIHLGTFVLLSVGSFVFPSKGVEFLPTVQIDMVALPDLVKSQENSYIDKSLPVKDAPPPPAPKPETESKEEEVMAKPEPEKKDDSMALKKQKEAEREAKKALDNLRAMKTKNLKEEEKRRQQEVSKREQDLKRFDETYRNAIKGNQVNEGSSSSGAMQATVNAYAGHIREKLNSNWNLPVFLQTKGYRAVVRMYIDARGNIVRYSFTQFSGNDAFDNQVKAALQNSTPFAPPPEEMAKGLRNSGLEVKFPL